MNKAFLLKFPCFSHLLQCIRTIEGDFQPSKNRTELKTAVDEWIQDSKMATSTSECHYCYSQLLPLLVQQ